MAEINIEGPPERKASLEKELIKGTETVGLSTKALQKLTECVILLVETVEKLDKRIDGLASHMENLDESVVVLTRETAALKNKIELHQEVIQQSIEAMEKTT